MFKEALRPVWAEIDLTNLDYNIKNIQKKIGKDTELIGIVKADAYGHGALRVAETLRANGVKTFATATMHEAIELRSGGITEDIIMLSLTPNMYADTVVEYGLTPVVCSYDNAKALSEAALAANRTVTGLIAADTGMGRIGYMTASHADISAAVADIAKIARLPGFKIKGMLSHMSTADEVDKSFSKIQEERYDGLVRALSEAGIDMDFKTFASSAATIDLPEVHFDAVRPGVILYGLYPSGDVNKTEIDIKPVMSVKANIVHIKDIPVGFSVGYGRKFIAQRPSRIATITLGYADGFSRPYSKNGRVIINGCYAPIAGNICMDQCMIDVTDVPDAKIGDEVIIMGSDGRLSITAEEIAEKLGTINYEIICAFGQRLPKVYI